MQPTEIIRITIENRDGCLYISSKDVPGLWLWGKDPEIVVRNIVPAIKTLYRDNRGLEVEVRDVPVSRTSKLLNWWTHRAPQAMKDKFQIVPIGNRSITSAHG